VSEDSHPDNVPFKTKDSDSLTSRPAAPNDDLRVIARKSFERMARAATSVESNSCEHVQKSSSNLQEWRITFLDRIGAVLPRTFLCVPAVVY
jgi:hypothetical protein